MANPYVKCGTCQGNVWPPSDVKNHKHLSLDELKTTLKKKYRTRKTGRSEAARPRTNSPKAQLKTLKPPRHAYGPF